MSSVHGHDVRLDWGLAVVEVLNAQRDSRSSMEGNHTARVGRMHLRESLNSTVSNGDVPRNRNMSVASVHTLLRQRPCERN